MIQSGSELQSLILELRARRGDSTQVEVKRGSGGVPRCAETLCAFGNMPGGGTLIVGLDEANGFIAVGVESVAAVEAGLVAQARTAVQPPVAMSFQAARVDGADVVIATVDGLPSHQRPCRTGGKAYLRQADGDYVMSEQEIQQTLALRDRPRYDAEILDETSLDNLDGPLARAYLSEVRSSSRRLFALPDDEVLERKRVRHGQFLTKAGAYALGEFPQQFEPSLSITAAVQLPREEGARARDLQHMDGPLPELLTQAMEWIRRNTQTTVRVGADGRGRDQAEIPLVAVRELIANALVHRDLGPHTQGKRVEIRLLDDKLVISNPGGLYGISSQQLGRPDGKSAVNEFLYDICKFTRTDAGDRVIEGEGGGIREVEASLRAAGLAPPHFIDKGISFTVVVPRHALLPLDDIAWLAANDAEHQLSPREGQMLTSMRHGQSWTNSVVRREFPGVDSREATRMLAHLVELEHAETVGERGARHYRLHPRWRTTKLPHLPTVSMSTTGPPPSHDPLPDLTDERLDPAPAEPRTPRDTYRRSVDEAALDALRQGPRTTREIAEAANLTIPTVRNSLRRLMDRHAVLVNGGWGVKGTTYELVQS